MTTVSLANRIQTIRHRLADIDAERADLPADGFERRAELLDEELTLHTRLAELKDEAEREGEGVVEPEAGELSIYEVVPRIRDDRFRVEHHL